LVVNKGKEFEQSLKDSATEQKVFFYRIKDVPQMMLKQGSKVSQNNYDAFMYHNNYLFAIELKSTKAKSISFSESMIKKHQIESLKEAVKYEGIIAGFIFQYREPDNKTYFVHIDDFITYKDHAEGRNNTITYSSKVNKSSIPIGICEEIGIELINIKKKVKFRYYVRKLLDELIKKHGKGK